MTTLPFDMAVLEIYLPLICSARLVLASREAAIDAQQLIAMMEDHGVTVVQGTPATWQLLLNAGWSGRPSLKALCGGEALTTELSRKLVERVGYLWNLYGPTETTVYSCGRRILRADERRLCETIGRPVANTQIYILDGHRQSMPVGVSGEIYIGGTGLARGYLNRPDLTAERFLPSPFTPGARLYRSGDRARYTAEGDVEFLGRTDNQLKIRGHRIEPREIEAALLRHAAVGQALVLAREDQPGEKRLVAYIVGAANSVFPQLNELRAHLKRTLPDYMIPAALVRLDALPVTFNGKVDLKSLPAPSHRSSLTAGYVAPRTATEQILARVWADLLGLDRVGIHDSFFEFGGHSVLVIKLVREIHELLKIRLPVRTVVESPSIASLAAALAAAQSRTEHSLTAAAETQFEEGVV